MNLDVHLPGIVEGDADAFAAWLVHAEPSIRSTLRTFATVVDVESVLQEALLRVWQFAPRVRQDGRGNSLLRYGTRVARNLAIDEVRRTERRGEVPPDHAPEAAEPVVSPPDPQLSAILRACLEALPSRPRQAIQARLTATGGRADHDLASGLDMKLNTFLKNVGRARRLLHACLTSRGVDPSWSAP